MSARRLAIERLERDLGHGFRDRGLLELALTHRSRSGEGAAANNQRLEFLGDAVLGAVAAEWLYRTLAGASEGELARRKSVLVSEPMLARRARELGLGDLLLLDAGEERTGGRAKDSLLADCFEALLGALYLEAGIDTVRRVLGVILERSIREGDLSEGQDAKNRLQELLQAASRPLPEYRLVEERGPDHDRTFVFECWIDGRCAARGEGPTKKVATLRAALQALQLLDQASAR